MDDESDPTTAHQNAQLNFDRLTAEAPRASLHREEQLHSEITTLPGSALKKLRHLQRACDEIFSAVAPYVACSRGCTSCCHYNVDVFPIEAERIEKRTGLARSTGPHPRQNFHGAPCTFLKDGICSIYEVRPMACRKHVALTSTSFWCDPERSGAIEVKLLQFSEVEAAIRYVVELDGRTDIADIRDHFPK